MATSKPRLDRRIVRSRNAILSAFERLLMEKPLADITVSAIAREANVDRKTFYVHFGTVDGLLDAIAVDVVEMIVDSVEKTLASMDGDTNERALGAAATFLPISFCWARASSNSLSAERRVSSERSTSSTSSTDSPRLRWDSLTMSACSRMN